MTCGQPTSANITDPAAPSTVPIPWSAPPRRWFPAELETVHGRARARRQDRDDVPGPVSLEEAFGRARPPVKVTILGHTWRTTPGIYGGVGHIVVDRAVKAATGVDAPDRVEVVMELDTAPRRVRVPEDLARALAGDPDANLSSGSFVVPDQRGADRCISSVRRCCSWCLEVGPAARADSSFGFRAGRRVRQRPAAHRRSRRLGLVLLEKADEVANRAVPMARVTKRQLAVDLVAVAAPVPRLG